MIQDRIGHPAAYKLVPTGQAQRRPGSEGDQQMSPERAKETNGHRRALVLFRPFRAGESDYRLPRAALRLPWADMFLALQADLCSTTRALPWADTARPFRATNRFIHRLSGVANRFPGSVPSPAGQCHRFSNSSIAIFSNTRCDPLPSYTMPTCLSSTRLRLG